MTALAINPRATAMAVLAHRELDCLVRPTAFAASTSARGLRLLLMEMPFPARSPGPPWGSRFSGESKITTDLGLLKRVALREIWRLESTHFSAWLESNIEALSNAIGLELEVRGREVAVGNFLVDLLAHDLSRDRVVVIENQLERTDHDHLGKLITYASGLKASVVVWVSPEFREEHRSALDWLNTNTDETLEFFAIQVEALRIDDSRPAVNFKVVVSPNDWQKMVGSQSRRIGASDNEKFYLDFNTDLVSRLNTDGFACSYKPRGVQAFTIHRWFQNTHLQILQTKGQVHVGFVIDNNDAAENKGIFEILKSASGSIEAALGFPVNWDFDPNRKRQNLWITLNNVDRSDEASVERAKQWSVDTLKVMKRVLQPYLERAVTSLRTQPVDQRPIEDLPDI